MTSKIGPGSGSQTTSALAAQVFGSEPDHRMAQMSTAFAELAVLACFNAEYLRQHVRRWRRVDVGLNILAAGLAGVAATTGLADLVGTKTVSWLALAAAVVVAVKANLRARDLGNNREKASVEFHAIHTEAQQWRTLDMSGTTWENCRQELTALTQRCDKAFELTTGLSLTVQAARQRRWPAERRALQACESCVGRAPESEGSTRSDIAARTVDVVVIDDERV